MSTEHQPLLGSDTDPSSNLGTSSRYLGNNEQQERYGEIPGHFDAENNPNMNDSYEETMKYTRFNHQSKILLNIVLFINALWLVFTFISDFFFDMNLLFKHGNRVSSFIDLNLITVAIIANILSLIFNYMEYYSVIDEKLNFINSLIILLNFFLFLFVGYTRERLGAVGKWTFIWCFLSFFISGMIDYQLSLYIKPLIGFFERGQGTQEGISIAGPNPNNQGVVVDSQVDSIDPVEHPNGRYARSPTPPSVPSDQDHRAEELHPLSKRQQKKSNKRKRKETGVRHTLTEWSVISLRNGLKILLMVWLVLFTLNNIIYLIDVHRIMSHIDEKTKPVDSKSVDVLTPLVQASGVTTDSMSTDYSTTIDGFFWNDLDSPSYKLHVTCYGNLSDYNEPLVIYEHGSADTAYTSGRWIKDMHNFKKLDKFCTYERPGYGISDSAPSPVSIGLITEAFKDVLTDQILPQFTKKKTDITVVGYDIGGLYAQVLCSKLTQCNKLMLIESWHEDLLAYKTWLPKDSFDHRTLNTLGKWNNFKIWFYGAFESALGLPLMKSLFINKSGSLDRISGDWMKYQGKYTRTRFQETLTGGLLSYNDVVESKKNIFERVDLSVVSSKAMIEKNTRWGDWQRSLAKLSKNVREWEIIDSNHYLYDSTNGKRILQDVLHRLVFE